MSDPVMIDHNKYHDRLEDSENEAEDTQELVDMVIGYAALYVDSECAEVISEAASEEREALMALMGVGIGLDVAQTGNLTVSQLMALASYALDFRNKIINNLEINRDLNYLARGK
jgi:hypothetical protein